MPEAFAVRVIVSVTLVLASAWGLTTVLRGGSSAIRHLVWACALFATLALPAVASFAPPWSVPILPAVSVASREAPPVQPPAESGVVTSGTADTLQISTPQTVFATVRHQRVRTMALTLWLVVALLGLRRLVISLIEAGRMAHSARLITDAAWTAPAAETAAALGLKVPVSLRCSNRVHVPVTYGLWRPLLVLPVDTATWSTEQRRAVLLHELAHVSRRDVFVGIFGQVATALYWFHPFVHLAMRRLRTEQEHACDDVALAAGVSASAYAGFLFDIARRSVSTPLEFVTVAIGRQSHLEDRMLSILDPNRTRSAPTRRVRFTVSCLFGIAALLMGTLQVTARHDQRQSLPGMHTTLPDGARLELRDYSMPREWSRYVEPETRARVRSVLVAGQNDADEQVREEITRALAILEAQPNERLLVSGSCRANCVVEDWALEAVMMTQQAIWGGSLIVDEAGLSSVDVEARRRAAMKGGAFRFPRGTAALANALMDTDHTVRMWAAIRLDSVRAVEAIPGWIWLLRDADASLRERAAISLGVIGDPHAVDPLTSTIFADPEPFVRSQAVRSLLFIAAGEDQ